MPTRISAISLAILLLPCAARGQVASGRFETLLLAVDPASHIVTGYHEDYVGFDQATGEPPFGCVFYPQGTSRKSICV
jgi:hypothetical protein